MKKIYKNVLFDLDGTLLDTALDIGYSLNRALKMHGYKERTQEECNSFLGNGVSVLVARAMGVDVSDPMRPVVEKEHREYYKDHNINKTVLYPGIKEVFERATEAGIKMAVVTNKASEACEKLREHFFKDYIEVVVGLSDESLAKPNPTGTYRAMELLGAKSEETLFVGDSEVDARTAKAAGLDCVLCSYGYTPIDILMAEESIGIISKPIELLKYLV